MTPIESQARDRLVRIARDLAGLIGPEPAARAMLGPAATLLQVALGDDGAAAFFRELAAEIDVNAECVN